MKAVSANELFNKMIHNLISQPYCKILFATLLYPISFIFTPNILGYENEMYGLSDFSKSQARKIISEKFNKFYNRKETFNPDSNVLLHYLGRNEINYTIQLFSYYIFVVKEPDVKRKSKSKKSSN